MINYQNVLTIDEFKKVSQNQYNSAIKEALNILDKVYLRAKYSLYDMVDEYKRIEISEIDNVNESKAYKEIIKSNIIFYNSNIIIKELLQENVTYDVLEHILNRITHLKALSNDELKENRLNALFIKICEGFKKYTNNAKYEIIINKLVQIIVFEKDLYLNLENELHRSIKTKKVARG